MDKEDWKALVTALNMATINRQYEAVVHQIETLVGLAFGHAPTGPDDPVLSRCPPEIVEGYRTFRAYVEAQQQQILGLPDGDFRERAAAQRVNEFFEKWYPLGGSY